MNPTQAFLDRHLGFLIRIDRKQMLHAALTLVLTIAFTAMFAKWFGVFIDTSEVRCMPERVYVGYPKTRESHVGDMVSFVSTDRETLGLFRGIRVGKIVKAQAGDWVVSDARGVFINGVFIASRNPISLDKLKTLKVTPINMNRVLKPGELFLMGTLPRSFDSRYWGVVNESMIDRFLKAVV